MKKEKKQKSGRKKKVFFRIGICFLSLILILVSGIYGALSIIYYGPSVSARNTFTATVIETSALKFIARMFLSEEEIAQIVGNDDHSVNVEITRTDIIDIEYQAEQSTTENAENKPFDKNAIEIIDISGRTYNGKLMIVNDPKRISIGTPKDGYGEDKKGMTTLNMVKYSNCIAGVNGGGFEDIGGLGSGGVPFGRRESGVVISKGELLWGSLSKKYEMIGFNSKGIMVLGTMTAQQALDMDIKEALNFGPYLILNGKPYDAIGEYESGLNPRTAIGQRKDGAVLLLVVNGRQSNSLGATYEDLIEIMVEYGAVNAANLDGGSSSCMIYNNELITTPGSLYGPRKMATNILVSRIEEGD